MRSSTVVPVRGMPTTKIGTCEAKASPGGGGGNGGQRAQCVDARGFGRGVVTQLRTHQARAGLEFAEGGGVVARILEFLVQRVMQVRLRERLVRVGFQRGAHACDAAARRIGLLVVGERPVRERIVRRERDRALAARRSPPSGGPALRSALAREYSISGCGRARSCAASSRRRAWSGSSISHRCCDSTTACASSAGCDQSAPRMSSRTRSRSSKASRRSVANGSTSQRRMSRTDIGGGERGIARIAIAAFALRDVRQAQVHRRLPRRDREDRFVLRARLGEIALGFEGLRLPPTAVEFLLHRRENLRKRATG